MTGSNKFSTKPLIVAPRSLRRSLGLSLAGAWIFAATALYAEEDTSDPQTTPNPTPANENLIDSAFFDGDFLILETKPKTLFFYGEIDRDDIFTLRRILRETPEIETLILSSGGGEILSALEFAAIVHDKQLNTTILSRDDCVSACAIVFLGGEERHASPDLLGVHQFFSNSDIVSNSDTQHTLGNIIEYLNDFETPVFIFEKMLITDPDYMYYFEADEMEEINRASEAIEAELIALDKHVSADLDAYYARDEEDEESEGEEERAETDADEDSEEDAQGDEDEDAPEAEAEADGAEDEAQEADDAQDDTEEHPNDAQENEEQAAAARINTLDQNTIRQLQFGLSLSTRYNGSINGVWDEYAQSALLALTNETAPDFEDVKTIIELGKTIAARDEWDYWKSPLGATVLLPFDKLYERRKATADKAEWISYSHGLRIHYEQNDTEATVAQHMKIREDRFDKDIYYFDWGHKRITSWVSLDDETWQIAVSNHNNGQWGTLLIEYPDYYWGGMVTAIVNSFDPDGYRFDLANW